MYSNSTDPRGWAAWLGLSAKRLATESVSVLQAWTDGSPAPGRRWPPLLGGTGPVAVLRRNTEGWPIELASSDAGRVFGRPADQLMRGYHYAELVHPDDLPQLQDTLRLAQGNPRVQTVKATAYRVVRPDGVACWVEDITRLRRNALGDVTHLEGSIEDVTERELMRQAAADSDRRLHTLMDNLPGMAFRCRDDPHWPMELVSDGCRALTGYAPADFMTRGRVSFAQLIHPSDRTHVWEQVRRAVSQQQPFVLEYRIVVAGGATRWVWMKGTAIRTPSGAVQALEGFVTDVTERKLAEQALCERNKELRCLGQLARLINARMSVEQTLRAFVEYIPGAYRHPKQVAARIRLGSETYASRAFRDTDCRQSSVIHMGARSEGLVEVCRIVEDASSPQPYFLHEEQLLLDTIASRIANKIQHSRVTEALRRSEARARALYEFLPLATFVWQRTDEGFVLVACNEAARRETGHQPAERLDQLGRQIQASRPQVRDDLERCWRERSVLRRELEEPPGDPRHARTLILTYGFAAPDLVLVHIEDITEQRRTEARLRVSQKLEAVGRLAGGLAHDFNNLLTVVNTYAELAASRLPGDQPVRRELLEIRKAADRAARLMRQLLAFGRKQVVTPTVLDLNAIVSDMRDMLLRLIGEDVQLETELDPEAGCIRADAGQVEQVIVNLVVNARDAMPKGGHIVLETRRQPWSDTAPGERASDLPPGPYVLLTVRDTGCGMSEDVRVRVFEPFYTTKEVGKGTGLGLATVYGIVQQAGGAISVESEVGKGAAFTVALPAFAGQPSRTYGELHTAPPQRGRASVLVVEDEDGVRGIAEETLSSAGYDVLVAANGQQALTLFEEREPKVDLLLTDVVMPGMSGRELAERLSQQQPSLRVLYMTGHTEDAILRHGVESARAQLISKPFSMVQLAAKVHEVLGSEPAPGPR